MMILDPLSIGTGGYIGIGPGANDFCPLPLAIGSDGYIRFEVEPGDRRDGDGGHGAAIWEPSVALPESDEDLEFAAIAITAIEIFYD
jgi:hypothetical protein